MGENIVFQFFSLPIVTYSKKGCKYNSRFLYFDKMEHWGVWGMSRVERNKFSLHVLHYLDGKKITWTYVKYLTSFILQRNLPNIYQGITVGNSEFSTPSLGLAHTRKLSVSVIKFHFTGSIKAVPPRSVTTVSLLPVLLKYIFC